MLFVACAGLVTGDWGLEHVEDYLLTIWDLVVKFKGLASETQKEHLDSFWLIQLVHELLEGFLSLKLVLPCEVGQNKVRWEEVFGFLDEFFLRFQRRFLSQGKCCIFLLITVLLIIRDVFKLLVLLLNRPAK